MKEQLSSLDKFLLWCSGADHHILAQEECLTERYKYSALGMTVLLTAIMALTSVGYVIFTVSAFLPISIIGGSFWGLTIFNLDRFFILKSNKKNSDSELIFYTITGLRLLIALLLSFLVAKSLELTLFKNEINRELREEKIAGSKKIELNSIEQQLRQSQQEKQELYDNLQNSDQNKQEFASSLKQQLEQVDNNVLQQQQKIYELQQVIDNTLQNSQNDPVKNKIELNSFLDRLAALEKIDAKYPIINSIDLLIISLYMIVEILPVLFKRFIIGKGSYDTLLELQQIHGVYHGYLRDQKEQRLQQTETILNNCIKSVINFEQEVAKRQEKYLRSKEKNRESLNNRNIKSIRENIEKQYSQEIQRFFEFCDRQIENHLNIIDNERCVWHIIYHF